LGQSSTREQGSGEDYIRRSFIICTHSPNINRMTKGMRGAGKVAYMEAKRNAYTVLAGIPERKRRPGKP
jgi:hypothetical protein